MEGTLWTNRAEKGVPSVSLTTAQKVSGAKSVKITNGSTPLYIAVLSSDSFAVTGGKKYSASFLTKTEGLDDKGVWMLVRWYNASGALVSTATLNAVTGTNGWGQIGKTVTAPTAAVTAVAEVRVRAKTGTAYIDDVTCTLMP